jgi:ribosomal-protein-alanine N-acetyltransferase
MFECELETDRLILRAPRAGDIAAMVPLANDWDVAKNLGRLPHPYSAEDAMAYLANSTQGRARGDNFHFAITRKASGDFLGGCGLHLRPSGHFEFGYWLGKPYWAKGYATEAALRLASYAFRELKIDRLMAGWYHDNPASGRVLAKLGCVPSGAEQRDCLARGHTVYCHVVTLTRETFAQRKAA